MNGAHVSNALFDAVCRCDDGNNFDAATRSPPMPSQHLTGHAFLRLEPSSDAVVGAILRLTRVHRSDGDEENLVQIHPLLLNVLVRSSNLVNRFGGKGSGGSNGRSVDTGAGAGKSATATGHPVRLASYDNWSYPGSHDARGRLERVIVNEVGTGECRAKVHVTYICSNTPRGREIFCRSGTDADVRKRVNLLLQTLVGEVIREGGIVGVDVRANNVVQATHGMDCYDDTYQEVIFFMIDKLLLRDESGFDHSVTSCLRLWPPDSFDVFVDAPNIDKRVRKPQTRMITDDQRNGVENTNGCCPGYGHVLEELVALASMDDPTGAPTAVVLSGCSGVGKSRMASWFEEELSSRLESHPQRISAAKLSAKDVLLDEASSSFDPGKVLDRLSDHQQSTSSNLPDRLLIIDDLDAIVTDSASSTLESEQLRALNAIVKLVDCATKDVARRYFVLGICRASFAALPHQLARVGRFEHVVTMSPPSLVQRKAIFKHWLQTLHLDDKASTISRWTDLLAPRTAGCVAADIRRICADALTSAATRSSRTGVLNSRSKNFSVKWEDIKEAARSCVPSQLSTMDVIPASSIDDLGSNGQLMTTKQEFELAWKNFGGYHEEKKRLYQTVVRPWKYHITRTTSSSTSLNDDGARKSINDVLQVSKPSGVLFHGPPGVGKSFAAMCLASSLGLHCVKSIGGIQSMARWSNLRSIFSRARSASPCILFFDELDSMATNREGGDSDVTSGVQSRILTTLLNEMDGINNAGGEQDVLVVAAMNRLDSVDSALLRPGRLEEHILLPYPRLPCIRDILRIQTSKMPLDSSVDFAELSGMLAASQASCADIEGMCRDACLIAMRRCSGIEALDNLSVWGSDFDEAFRRLKKNHLRNDTVPCSIATNT
ncbi:hypothetical protein ACHAWF_008503 [Thalassiosira exigua]